MDLEASDLLFPAQRDVAVLWIARKSVEHGKGNSTQLGGLSCPISIPKSTSSSSSSPKGKDPVTPAMVLYSMPQYRQAITSVTVVSPIQQLTSNMQLDPCCEIAVLRVANASCVQNMLSRPEIERRKNSRAKRSGSTASGGYWVNHVFEDPVFITHASPPPHFAEFVESTAESWQFFDESPAANLVRTSVTLRQVGEAIFREEEESRSNKPILGTKKKTTKKGGSSECSIDPHRPALRERDSSILCQPFLETGNCPVLEWNGSECPYRHITGADVWQSVPHAVCQFQANGATLCKKHTCLAWHGPRQLWTQLVRFLSEVTEPLPEHFSSEGAAEGKVISIRRQQSNGCNRGGWLYRVDHVLETRDPLHDSGISRQELFAACLQGNLPFVPSITEECVRSHEFFRQLY